MKNMDWSLRLWLAFIVVIVSLVGELIATECVTPDSVQGTCIRIEQCPHLMALRRQRRPLSQETRDFLQRSKCIYQNNQQLHCCSSQSTSTTPAAPTVRIVSPLGPRNVLTHKNIGLINGDTCGLRPDLRPKIINGNEASLMEYPWMALLKYYNPSEGHSFRCGGSLINERYVLTAAHCVNSDSHVLVSVRLGEHNTKTSEDCDLPEANSNEPPYCAPPYQEIAVDKTIKYPGTTRKYDIALLRLAQPADLTQINVVPICLPVDMALQTKNTDGLKMTVAGWGVTNITTGGTSDVLMEVVLPIMSQASCKSVYKRTFSIDINERQLCAGGSRKLQDSCKGDSGGPLMSYQAINATPRMVQFGVVSYGHLFCTVEGIPGVYVRVSHYLTWILDNIHP